MKRRAPLQAIESLDLGSIKFKVRQVTGWDSRRIDIGELLYRRFLTLIALYPEHVIVPSPDVDMFWHNHILDTLKYGKDCEEIFGYFLHHFPYFGLRDGNDKASMANAFAETLELYALTFGSEAESYSDSEYGTVCGGCPCTKVSEGGFVAGTSVINLSSRPRYHSGVSL